MKVLLIGGGGREDALAWAIARSPRLTRLDCAPGNAGTATRARNVALEVSDVAAVERHVEREGHDLVVVGPEAPLVAGVGDRLRARGVPVFGPDRAAAQIEGSKVFAKRFMERHRIPTAGFRVVDSVQTARSWLESSEARFPLVVKADGLAAGKGVLFADDAAQALRAVESMLVDRRFGDAGSRVLLEERLVGREVSLFALTDGSRVVGLAPCQDYKRAEDGDRGPNTGGMGSYSPSAFLDDDLASTLLRRIVGPTVDGLAAEDRPYRGVLYVGLMLTEDGPRVLEYNARFGDPETQALLPRIDGDWLPVLDACARGTLGRETAPRWRPEASVTVVLTVAGYPGSYDTGAVIHGAGDVQEMPGVEVFHAGTRRADDGTLVTAGGRVLAVTALGKDLEDARLRAYEGVARIRWDGEHHRSDIAEDAVRRLDAGTKGEVR